VEIPVSQARDQIGELLSRVRYGGERITLMRRGRPIAVLVSPADLELLEQLGASREPAGAAARDGAGL